MEDKRIDISNDMDAYEAYKKLKEILPMKKYEKGYYIDYLIECKDYSKQDASIIYDFVRECWETTDTRLSVDTLIETMCFMLENEMLTIDNVISMNKHRFLDLADDQNLDLNEKNNGKEL